MKEENKSALRQSIKDGLIQQQQKEVVNKELKESTISFSVNALLGFGN